MSSTSQARRQARVSKRTAVRKKPATVRYPISRRLSVERVMVSGTILLTVAIVAVIIVSQIPDRSQAIPDETVVHNLEHGGVWLSYRDADDVEAIRQLQDIASRYPQEVIVTYRPTNDSRIAVAAWGRLLKLDSVAGSQINYFITHYQYKGPENPPRT